MCKRGIRTRTIFIRAVPKSFCSVNGPSCDCCRGKWTTQTKRTMIVHRVRHPGIFMLILLVVVGSYFQRPNSRGFKRFTPETMFSHISKHHEISWCLEMWLNIVSGVNLLKPREFGRWKYDPTTTSKISINIPGCLTRCTIIVLLVCVVHFPRQQSQLGPFTLQKLFGTARIKIVRVRIPRLHILFSAMK